MDSVNVLMWGRTVERLLIILFSGLSMVLGWNLFSVRLLKDQTAEFSTKDWKIRLERVGPGVFFALFGAAGFIFAVSHPLNIKEGVYAPRSEATQGLEANWLGGGKDALRGELRAINTVELLAIPALIAHENPGEKEALDRARQVLEARKAYLLRVELGGFPFSLREMEE